MTIKSLDQQEKGYIAGVLDSDGAILIRRIGKSFSFYCSIQFVGTFEQMRKIRGILGMDSNKIYQHGNRWMFLVGNQQDVVSLLKRIWDCLTKKPEASLVLKMRDLHDRGNSAGRAGTRISQDVLNLRLNIFKQYKTYKARSGGHITNWDEFGESLTDAWSASQGNTEPSINELLDKLTNDERAVILRQLLADEGVTTKAEIMPGSVPPEREDIV